jgi:23S rRNA (uracil1939-C5)-methyltransferase
MLIVVFAYEDTQARTALLDAVKSKFPQISSLHYVINGKRNDSISDLDCIKYYGDDCIYDTMEDIKFRIGPKSFYQTNSKQAYRLYSVVRDFANLKGNEVLYDLYTGTGTIGLFLSSKAKKVVGIEYVKEAIDDAKINAENNGITNSFFYAGDMKDMLTGKFIEENGQPDIVVLDPPRAGIHADVAKVLLEAAPKRMVYVSCNPASQARDLAILSEKYRITAVRPVDMFPHTHHVENVVALELK